MGNAAAHGQLVYLRLCGRRWVLSLLHSRDRVSGRQGLFWGRGGSFLEPDPRGLGLCVPRFYFPEGKVAAINSCQPLLPSGRGRCHWPCASQRRLWLPWARASSQWGPHNHLSSLSSWEVLEMFKNGCYNSFWVMSPACGIPSVPWPCDSAASGLSGLIESTPFGLVLQPHWFPPRGHLVTSSALAAIGVGNVGAAQPAGVWNLLYGWALGPWGLTWLQRC